jgi:plastocyanin
MRGRQAAAALIVLVLLVFGASGCNSKLLRPPAIVFADSGEYGVKTSVREENRSFPSVLTAFLPSAVPLHPGDSVNFQLRDTGEPHSVALGGIIDAAVDAAEALGPSATLKQIEALKQMKAVPSVISTRVGTGDLAGVPELNGAAAERCFLADGLPSAPSTCTEVDQPDFDGTQPFFSSGVLEEGEPFRIKLSDETRPGSYRFMCLVHRSAMTGALEVVDKNADRPAVAKLREDADREQNEVASTLEPAARIAATDAKQDGGPVITGTGPEGLSRGFVSAFFDRDVKTTIGKPLRFEFHRAHTITFNPSRDAKEGFILSDGDGVRVNEDAYKAVGSAAPPTALVKVTPAKKSYGIQGGTWDGEGEWSSGVIRATPPTKVTYEMRFSKAGRYRYSCLIHPSMHGTVEVS